NDHVSALAQGVDPFRLRWRGLAVGGNRQASKQDAEQSQSNDGHNLLLPMAINGKRARAGQRGWVAQSLYPISGQNLQGMRLSMQMQQMRQEQAERGDGNAGHRKRAGDPGQYDHASDDGRRSQHDADLEGGGGDFVMVILCRSLVALMLGMPGALGEFFRALAGFRLRAI